MLQANKSECHTWLIKNMFKVNYISVEDRRETFNNSLFPHGEIFGFWLAEAGLSTNLIICHQMDKH